MAVKSYLENLFSLEGKVVLFTGATGGIGSELCKGLAGSGATVALCDIDLQRLEELKNAIEAEGGKASAHLINVLEKDSIDSCVEEVGTKYGQIDVLVNCAGVNKREGILDVEEDTYDRIMDINLKGAFLTSQAVGHYMRKQNRGSIINIASHNTGWVLGGCSVYAASKSGMVALTKAQAVEWAKFNIRANAISPGHIKTQLTQVTWDHPERSKYLLDRIAMNRPGYPEDIVGVCILLASDASSYISGSEYRVDGGCIAGGQPWPYDTKY